MIKTNYATSANRAKQVFYQIFTTSGEKSQLWMFYSLHSLSSYSWLDAVQFEMIRTLGRKKLLQFLVALFLAICSKIVIKILYLNNIGTVQ